MKSKQRWYQRHQLFNKDIPAELFEWLFDDSSLTARLISACAGKFTVRVVSQRWQKLSAQEAATMGLNNVHSALVRQVVLCCDERPVVFARTIIPSTTIKGSLRRYANMGNRPLGAMLFSDRTMRRESVQVTRLDKTHMAYRYTDSNSWLWGRQSVFRVAGKPLLVGEYFLPELLQ